MSKFIDLSGKEYGRLCVMWPCGRKGRRQIIHWLCVCDCGAYPVVSGCSLRRGKTNSCGCLKREQHHWIGAARTHGQSRSGTWRTWVAMRNRCSNANNSNYPDYGAKGITVCPRWRDSFEAFMADMGPKPGPKHTIDRFPNKKGDYEPGNCRWATPEEQSQNQKSNKLTPAKVIDIRTRRAAGESYPSIARSHGIKPGTAGEVVRRRTWANIA